MAWLHSYSNVFHAFPCTRMRSSSHQKNHVYLCKLTCRARVNELPICSRVYALTHCTNSFVIKIAIDVGLGKRATPLYLVCFTMGAKKSRVPGSRCCVVQRDSPPDGAVYRPKAYMAQPHGPGCCKTILRSPPQPGSQSPHHTRTHTVLFRWAYAVKKSTRGSEIRPSPRV